MKFQNESVSHNKDTRDTGASDGSVSKMDGEKTSNDVSFS